MSVFGISFGKNKEQAELARLIYENNTPIVFCTGHAGTGKALENGTPVLTERGWVPIEQLTLQDKIYGRDGNLHNLLGIFPQGLKDVYQITFSDCTSINCCAEHLWTIQTRTQRDSKRGEEKEDYFPITCTTQELIEKYPLYKNSNSALGYKAANIYIPMVKPINFIAQNHLIAPYLLGCMLGDGYMGEKGNIKFTNAEKDILDKVSNLLKPLKIRLEHIKNYDYDFHNDDENYKYHVNQFRDELKRLKLFGTESGTKFVPQEYLYDSIENRIELLKGLIDTNGYWDSGAYDICLKSKQLIQNIQFIAESLGLTAVYTEKDAYCSNATNGHKDCGMVYRLRIKPSYYIQKIHSSQHREQQWKKPQAWARRSIEKIEKLNYQKEMTCIMVDSPDHLFVTKNCIVTHNTFVALACALQLQEDKKYNKIIYARNPIQVGEDMGFLPGDAEEKYSPFMGPLLDNLENLVHAQMKGASAAQKSAMRSKVEDLKNRIEICPIAFLRGRSFENAIIIIDEAQNLDLTALKTILTRVGKYCKIVLLGSMNQVDDWRQRKKSQCDFLKVMNKLNGLPYVGYVDLVESMRSPTCVEIDNMLGEIIDEDGYHSFNSGENFKKN